MKPRKGSHSVFSVLLHFVFVTHYRRKAINASMLTRIESMCNQVCKKMGCKLVEFSGESDHVHLLVDFHPRNSISAVVGSLKAATSRTMKREYKKELKEFYRSGVSFWSGSYYVASTGGAPIEKLRQYLAISCTPRKRSWELRGHHPGSSRAIHPHPASRRMRYANPFNLGCCYVRCVTPTKFVLLLLTASNASYDS